MANKLIRRADYMTPNQMRKALRSLELYLEGKRWNEIGKLGGYGWLRFSHLMVQFPDLSKAYAEARRSSGHSFEDKALLLAEELTQANEFTGTQVQAHKAAMEQYRWSAARRNPTEYAEAGANKISMIVPIQINSSLNLAEPGAGEEKAAENPYEVRSEVLARVEEAGEELPVELDNLREQLGMPLEAPAAIKKRPSPGRLPKGHRNPQMTGATRAVMLKKARKNPTVARALGLDTENEPSEHAGGQSPDLKPVTRINQRQRQRPRSSAEPNGKRPTDD